jgi:pimeloyl-ACP methyl ester carboxylesterase
VTRIVSLATGADSRLWNEGVSLVVVLANGGTAKAVPGTWSATSELLAAELAPRFDDVEFVEVRYRVKSWNELPSCVADVRAALDETGSRGPRPTLMIGFSMGGAVSIGVADARDVVGVLGLAPWIPARLSLEPLAGKRLDVLHGSWDRYLPGVPGVSPESSRHGFERARSQGVEGTYTLVPRGLHGAAVRRRSGRLLRLPRWRDWVEHVAVRLEAFRAGPALERGAS